MTTILAIRESLEMWSDTRMYCAGVRQQDNYRQKICYVDLIVCSDKSLIQYDIPTQILVGFSGEVQCGLEFVAWCREGFLKDTRPTFPDDTGFRGMVLFPTKKLYVFELRCFPMPQDDVPYYIIGSGQEFCHGALAVGAPPQLAMEVAAALDIHSGLPVHRLTLKQW